jgi:molecular chaperone DnaK
VAEIAIGIDLGTSNSCVAVARSGRVEVIPNAYGERVTPSVVAFHEDGSIAVGQAAKSAVVHDPEHTVYSAKRLIGRYFFSEEVKKARAVCAYHIVEGPSHGVRIQVRDEELAIPEISALVLREMKTLAEQHLGHEVRQAVITVPAYFNDNQRQSTRDAGRIAGLEVLRLINEPTAAALAYGFGRGLRQRVAVYDLGGGTFDVSVLEIGEDVFEVLSTSGDTYLGGDDFDDRLIDLFADEFQAARGINLRADPYALEKLKVAAETAKKGLSVEEQVEVRIPEVVRGKQGEPLSLERTLTRDELGSLVMDLVQRTFKVCDEALQQAGLVARDLDGVILVGGPTRLPLVRRAVSDYFQQEPKGDVDPDEVVAMGAAIHAASLVSEEPSDALLLDVTPLSLRIGVAGGLAETVIERNTPVPIEQTRTFTTFQDFQESVRIRICQGESRKTEENALLGEFAFSGFRKAPRGEVRIDVTFAIDTDGIVNVTARDPETGQAASTRVTLSSGLSESELQSILEAGKGDRLRTEPGPARAPEAAPAAGGAPTAPEPEPATLGPLDAPVTDEAGSGLELAGPETAAETPAAPLPPARDDEIELDPADLESLETDPAGAAFEAEAIDTAGIELAGPDDLAEAEPEEAMTRLVDQTELGDADGAELTADDAAQGVDLETLDVDMEMDLDAAGDGQAPPAAADSRSGAQNRQEGDESFFGSPVDDLSDLAGEDALGPNGATGSRREGEA